MKQTEEKKKLRELGSNQKRAAAHLGMREDSMSRALNGIQDAKPPQYFYAYLRLLEAVPAEKRKDVLSDLDQLADKKEGA